MGSDKAHSSTTATLPFSSDRNGDALLVAVRYLAFRLSLVVFLKLSEVISELSPPMGSPALKSREEASATALAFWHLLIAQLARLYYHRGQSIMNPDVNKGN